MSNEQNENSNSNDRSNCNNINNKTTTSQKTGLGMENWSYADFVLLSSILSYTIAEELNDIDLDLLIVFLGTVQSELATLRLQRGIKKNSESIIVEEDITNVGTQESIIPTTRNLKTRTVKKIKRKKKKVINKNIKRNL